MELAQVDDLLKSVGENRAKKRIDELNQQTQSLQDQITAIKAKEATMNIQIETDRKEKAKLDKRLEDITSAAPEEIDLNPKVGAALREEAIKVLNESLSALSASIERNLVLSREMSTTRSLLVRDVSSVGDEIRKVTTNHNNTKFKLVGTAYSHSRKVVKTMFDDVHALEHRLQQEPDQEAKRLQFKIKVINWRKVVEQLKTEPPQLDANEMAVINKCQSKLEFLVSRLGVGAQPALNPRWIPKNALELEKLYVKAKHEHDTYMAQIHARSNKKVTVASILADTEEELTPETKFAIGQLFEYGVIEKYKNKKLVIYNSLTNKTELLKIVAWLANILAPSAVVVFESMPSLTGCSSLLILTKKTESTDLPYQRLLDWASKNNVPSAVCYGTDKLCLSEQLALMRGMQLEPMSV